MRPMHQDAAVLRRSLLLIVGLIAVSTVLFVVGVTVERQGEATEGAAAHQEVSGEPASGSHEEAGGEGAHHEEAGSHQEAGGTVEHRGESFLGINPDATWVVITVVIGWRVLAAALLLISGPPVLILVALAAAVATVLDVMEVLRQLALANGTVAILAALVALSHAAIAILSALLLRRYGGAWRQGSREACWAPLRLQSTFLTSGGSDHYHHSRYTDRCPQQVPPVRPEPVHDHTPSQRQRDEHPSVGCVDTAELGDGLQGSYYPVGREDQRPEQRPQHRLVLAHPSPHEVATPDLTQPR
jgi:hypothetical protein